MTKSELKAIIRECYDEVLTEGLFSKKSSSSSKQEAYDNYPNACISKINEWLDSNNIKLQAGKYSLTPFPQDDPHAAMLGFKRLILMLFPKDQNTSDSKYIAECKKARAKLSDSVVKSIVDTGDVKLYSSPSTIDGKNGSLFVVVYYAPK